MSEPTFGQLLAAAIGRAGMNKTSFARASTTDRPHLDAILDDEHYPSVYYWSLMYLELRRQGGINHLSQVDDIAHAIERDPRWEIQREERSRKAALRFERASKRKRKPTA